MAKNINIVALNKHIAYLTEENQRLQSELNLVRVARNEALGFVTALRKEIEEMRKAGTTIVGEQGEHFKPFPTIVPYPDPVEIVAHGLRIKIEKV